MKFSLSALLGLASLAVVLAAPVNEPRATCADVIVIYARGTTETAPIGSVVGPGLKSALQGLLGSKTLAFNGVTYAANIPGFLEGGDPQGSQNMANDLTNAANSCPNSALVTAGYSQGGQLVHNSAKLLSAKVQARINAAVIFGDPDDGSPVAGVSASKTLVICHTGDNICAHGIIVLPPHLNYGMDTPTAAAFIASKV
ncbi:unnamed protein product [Mycena citricolor]|uniref:cutinase n=1 Tax=Mycena citricolor TaxID=2018698 RepID=A0AAD2GVU1_9AGAR|nr:unnamed protein product [Mycena citricolor]CAK5263209.1 unnamed protein product [Mycena citricolor]